MRGTVESYDGESGLILARNGSKYRFARSALVKRSRQPVTGARIVFRLRRGAVYKAAAGPPPSDSSWMWDVASLPFEMLLYLIP